MTEKKVLENPTPDTKTRIKSIWLVGHNKDKERELRLSQLRVAQDGIFDILRREITLLHKDATRRMNDTENPNFPTLAVTETRYKKALQDIYDLLPTFGDLYDD